MPGRLVTPRDVPPGVRGAGRTRDGVPFFPDAAQNATWSSPGSSSSRSSLRGDLRSDRSGRPARSDHHRHRARAGLLLPLALLAVRAAAAVDSRPSLILTAPVVGIVVLVRAAVPRRHRREELAAAAGARCSSVVMVFLLVGTLTWLGTFARRGRRVMDAWSALPTPVAYLEGPLAARAAGRARSCRASSAATATRSAARAACAARRSTTSRRG